MFDKSGIRSALGRSRLFFAFKVALAVVISFYLGQKVSEGFSELDPVIGGLWSAISAVFVIEEGHVETYKNSFLRLLGSFIGAVISAVFLFLIGNSLWALGICIFFTVTFCSIFKLHRYLRTANVATIVIVIVSRLQQPANIWLFCLSRFIDAAIGISVAICILHALNFKRRDKPQSL